MLIIDTSSYSEGLKLVKIYKYEHQKFNFCYPGRDKILPWKASAPPPRHPLPCIHAFETVQQKNRLKCPGQLALVYEIVRQRKQVNLT